MRLRDALSRGFVFLGVFGTVHQALQETHGRLDFASLPLGNDGAEEFPHIAGSSEVVAAVAEDVHGLHQLPALQLLDAVADVRTRHAEGVDDFISGHRASQDVEQGMDLRHGAVHPPLGAHFAPVQDKFFSRRIEFHGVRA